MISAREIKGRLNGRAILDKMHAAEVQIKPWCKARGIIHTTFYRVLRGDSGERRSAYQALRIYKLLAAEGWLIENEEFVNNGKDHTDQNISSAATK